jgi:DNA polymerase III delta prime subunit
MLANKASHIIPALQSRCTRFKFANIPIDQAFDRIKFISENEKIHLTDSLVNEVIKVSRGDMRKCINILQSLYLAVSWDSGLEDHSGQNGRIIEEGKSTVGQRRSGSDLTLDDFYRIVGTISPAKIETIFGILLKHNFSEGSSSKLTSDQGHHARKRRQRRRDYREASPRRRFNGLRHLEDQNSAFEGFEGNRVSVLHRNERGAAAGLSDRLFLRSQKYCLSK